MDQGIKTKGLKMITYQLRGPHRRWKAKKNMLIQKQMIKKGDIAEYFPPKDCFIIKRKLRHIEIERRFIENRDGIFWEKIEDDK